MSQERDEALRWAGECVPMLEQMSVEQCSAHLRQAVDVMKRLIRLARQSAPQGEPAFPPLPKRVEYLLSLAHWDATEHALAIGDLKTWALCAALPAAPDAQAEIDELRQINESLQEARWANHYRAEAAEKERDALLRAQLEAKPDVVRDAERWRALRGWPYAQGALKTTWPLWGPGTIYPTAASVIDAQIDEYMAALQPDHSRQVSGNRST